MYITHQCFTPFKDNVYLLAGGGELMYGLKYQDSKNRLQPSTGLIRWLEDIPIALLLFLIFENMYP
ncbi:MAG TPA: hypothetical protein VKA34_11640 [Balneolales bacterium]|nr:hypothetical protein [Balneolales bacterium]